MDKLEMKPIGHYAQVKAVDGTPQNLLVLQHKLHLVSIDFSDWKGGSAKDFMERFIFPALWQLEINVDG